MLNVSGAGSLIRNVRREGRVELTERLFLTTDFTDDADVVLSVVSVLVCGLLFFAVTRPAVAASR